MSNQENLIKQAEEAYDLGNPIMTDEQYDALTADMGVEQAIGGAEIPESKKIRHMFPMLSLDKVRTEEGVISWLEKMSQKIGQNFGLSIERKYDGFAISAVYIDGKLEYVATRGNGSEGERITQNAKTLLPESLPYEGRVEIRGEVLMTRKSLEVIQEEYGITYQNPRNAVPGLIRRLEDTSHIVKDHCIFVIYDVYGDVSYANMLQDYQETFVFSGDESNARGSNEVDFQENILKIIRSIGESRESLEYDIDGAVLKIIDASFRENLGSTSHHPNWAIAFKFEDVMKPTTLRDIRWARGRTGRVVPTAIFDSVDLGTNVTRATMHNYDIFSAFSPCEVGDTVFVKRSGEVIPYIDSIIHNGSGGEHFEAPLACPDCGIELVIDGADIKCTNTDCGLDMKTLNAIQVLNVKGVAWALLNKLMLEDEYLYDAVDIVDALDKLLTMEPEHVQHLDGYGANSANKAVEALSVMRDSSLAGWLAALGLRGIAHSSAQKIMLHFKTLDQIDPDEIRNGAISGLGAAAANSIEDHKELISKLDDMLTRNEVEKWVYDPTEDVDEDSEFFGKNIVVTGSFEGYKRPDIESWLVGQGANIQSGVSKTTNILFAGARAGSKMAKATSLQEAGYDIEIREDLPF